MCYYFFMVAVHIRKQGGAAIITIPSSSLRQLNWEIGTTLELEVQEDVLLAHPVKVIRQRYSLSELLEGASQENIQSLNAETAWAREGISVGRELT